MQVNTSRVSEPSAVEDPESKPSYDGSVGTTSTNPDWAKAALKSLLFNEKLADVSLEGSDGVLVDANRCILAARSGVFCTMLYDNSSAQSSVVQVRDYTGSVLKSVVEYCYTNFFLSVPFANPWKLAQELVGLAHAAVTFELPGLCELAEECSIAAIEKHPHLALAFFDISRRLKSEKLHLVADFALKEICHSLPSLIANSKSQVFKMNESALKEILEIDDIQCKEMHRFTLLMKWACTVEETESRDCENKDDRLTKAKSMTKFVHLDRIPPSFLSSSVKTSGLISVEELCAAYERQALTSEREKEYVPRERFEKVPVKPVMVSSCGETKPDYSLSGGENENPAHKTVGRQIQAINPPEEKAERNKQWSVGFVKSCEYVLHCGPVDSPAE